MTDAQTDLTLTIIWIVGTMITLGLGIYALILFRQLKRKQEEAATAIKQRNDELADQIGALEAEKEKMLIDHYLKLQAECTPEQREKLASVFQRAMKRPRFHKKRKGKMKEAK